MSERGGDVGDTAEDRIWEADDGSYYRIDEMAGGASSPEWPMPSYLMLTHVDADGTESQPRRYALSAVLDGQRLTGLLARARNALTRLAAREGEDVDEWAARLAADIDKDASVGYGICRPASPMPPMCWCIVASWDPPHYHQPDCPEYRAPDNQSTANERDD